MYTLGMLHQPSYQVLRSEGQFQLRRYDAYNIVIAPDQDLDSFKGFQMVFDYIQGENQDQQKISMTTPVINDLEQLSVKTTAFVMPSEFDFDTLPEPMHNRVKKVHVPAQMMATIRFSMSVSPRKIEQYEQALKEWIAKEKLTIVSATKLARYNPPFIPGFLKRNELWIEVTQ